jgi:hypothetical protein
VNTGRSGLEGGIKMKALRSFQCASIILIIVYLSSVVRAQMHGAPPSNTNESWTATTLISEPNTNTNPPHVSEAHVKSGNGSLDRQSVEVFGPESRYQTYLYTETETVQESPATLHSIVRTYRTDANGQKTLVRVTDEKTQSSAHGEINVVRTVLDQDVNGNLQIVQYEVTETTNTNPNSRETKTTVYVPLASGSVAPRTDELQQSSADGAVLRKKTPLPEGWQVSEVTESTTKEDGSHRNSEERVSRRDSDGRLSPFSRRIAKETDFNGRKVAAVETYSLDLIGLARDGKLHLSERSTTIQKIDKTEQEVEQLDPGDPNAGLKVMKKTTDIVVSGPTGTQETKTIETRNTNGVFTVESVAQRKSNQVAPTQGQTRGETPKYH